MSLQCKYNLAVDAQNITPSIINKLGQVTRQPVHPFLTSDAVTTHIDFDKIITSRNKFYILTGRGPSDASLHLGHVIPFKLACYLQKAFKVPCVIQISDDEKYLTRKVSFGSHISETIRDILAFGFNLNSTFVCVNTEYMASEKAFYKNVLQLGNLVTLRHAQVVYNHRNWTTVAAAAYSSVQAVAALASTFPRILDQSLRCLVVCSTDQDVFFRPLRELVSSHKHEGPAPAMLYSNLLPTYENPDYKMSSSGKFNNILLSSSENVVEFKLLNAHPKVVQLYNEWFQGPILDLIKEHQCKKTDINEDDIVKSQHVRMLQVNS